MLMCRLIWVGRKKFSYFSLPEHMSKPFDNADFAHVKDFG